MAHIYILVTQIAIVQPRHSLCMCKNYTECRHTTLTELHCHFILTTRQSPPWEGGGILPRTPNFLTTTKPLRRSDVSRRLYESQEKYFSVVESYLRDKKFDINWQPHKLKFYKCKFVDCNTQSLSPPPGILTTRPGFLTPLRPKLTWGSYPWALGSNY